MILATNLPKPASPTHPRSMCLFGIHAPETRVYQIAAELVFDWTRLPHYSDFKYSTKSLFSWSVKWSDLKLS